VVAAEVPDAVDAVAEDAEAEQDADDEQDHQDHQQVAPHPLPGELELAHGVSPAGRLMDRLRALPLSASGGRRKTSHAASYRRKRRWQVCRPVTSPVWRRCRFASEATAQAARQGRAVCEGERVRMPRRLSAFAP
jgi:hypothetical protein